MALLLLCLFEVPGWSDFQSPWREYTAVLREAVHVFMALP